MSYMRDNRKRSVYVPSAVLDELLAEAKRQDRSISWLLQTAWKIAREQMLKLEGGAKQ